MPRSLIRATTSLCAIVGAITLISSFIINPAPPSDMSVGQLRDFALEHHTTIVLGAWLQGMGSLLLVLFAIALVHLAGAARTIAGWITLLSSATILMVSLVEVTFYLTAVQAAASNDVTTGLVADALIKAVQHVFLIAPALLLPVGT